MRVFRQRSILLASTVLALAPMSAIEASAQALAVSDNEGYEEILITATRRVQSVLEVPISITAVTGLELEQRGVERLRDLQYAIPGLSIADRGPGQSQIQLRGVSQFVGAPTIGTYIDELSIAPASTGGALAPQLIDLARVEVLRGPQPTLYGESSMGGTIRYITADPDLSEVNARVGGEIATTKDGEESYRAEGFVNVPLVTDRWGLRVSGAYEKAGGWIDTPRGDDQNDNTTYHLRAKTRFEATENFTISILGVIQKIEEDESTLSLADRTLPTPGQAPTTDKFGLFNMILTYEFDFGTLLSSTGHIDRDSSNAIDQSGFLVPFSSVPPAFGGFGLPVGAITSGVAVTEGDFRRWAQELRLTSNGEGPLTYVIGGNFILDSGSGESFSITAPTPVDQLPFDLFGAASSNESDFWTVYGEIGYTFFDKLTATAGARYFQDKRSIFIPGSLFAAEVSLSETFDSFNPRVSLSYDTGDGVIFANVAKGFRTGGFNPPLPIPNFVTPPDFDPETLWSYEIGTKQSFFDSRLVVELAVYYNDWTDIQQQPVPAGGVPLRFTVNGGEASGFGFDFALQAKPTEGLTISATVGFTDMEFDEASATKAPGDPLDLVPRWTASGAVDYRHPIGEEKIAYGRLDIGYTAGSQNTLRSFAGTGFPIFSFVDERTIINGRFGVQFERFEVFVFGENLTDDNGTTFPAIGTVTIPARGRPRTFGIGANVNF